MVIVDALSTLWGVDPRQPRGKIVWSHFPTASPATPVQAGQEIRAC
jgi:hypothetical protein